jgi:hypothetical protein
MCCNADGILKTSFIGMDDNNEMREEGGAGGLPIVTAKKTILLLVQVLVDI